MVHLVGQKLNDGRKSIRQLEISPPPYIPARDGSYGSFFLVLWEVVEGVNEIPSPLPPRLETILETFPPPTCPSIKIINSASR